MHVTVVFLLLCDQCVVGQWFVSTLRCRSLCGRNPCSRRSRSATNPPLRWCVLYISTTLFYNMFNAILWKKISAIIVFCCLCSRVQLSLVRFYRASNYASAVLAVVILSVRLSVHHTRALWQNQTMHYGYFDTTRKGNHSSILTPTVVGGRRPFRRKIVLKVTHPLRNSSLRKTLTSTDFRF